MGSNHMHDIMRESRLRAEQRNEEPTQDEQTNKTTVYPETDMDKLNRFLITVAESEVSLQRKILMLKKIIDIITEKED